MLLNKNIEKKQKRRRKTICHTNERKLYSNGLNQYKIPLEFRIQTQKTYNKLKLISVSYKI